MLGIGLLGTGLHGSRYAAHLARGDVPGVRLVACSRRDRLLGEAQARELGCRYHASLEELVHDPEVDALLVVTPATCHAGAVLAAVRAHKPVLVEKPLTCSLAEARSLRDEVRARSGKVMVAQTLRWEPTYGTAASLTRELGPVKAAGAVFLRGDFTRRGTSDSRPGEFHRAAWSSAIHHLDWAGRLFPAGFARAHAHETPGEEGLSLAALLEAREGGTFSLSVRLRGEGAHDAFTVFAERGALVGDRLAHRLDRLDRSGAAAVDVGPKVATLPLVVASFRDFVAGKIPNPVPLEDGVRAVARVEACVRSIALGTPVPVEEEVPHA
jgi:predicted dehydrogenase